MQSIDLSELQKIYVVWRENLKLVDSLLDEMESQIDKQTNEFIKNKLQRNYQVLSDNYENQIDLVNAIYDYIHNHQIPRSIYESQKEKLEKCRLYINALGGDFNNVNWMRKSDFPTWR